ncbi:MAG: hypothetical protein JKY65_04465 [Planctomycetes bacterium]|nr:hypothetical protein [Planctomycetota bacterium]
MNNLDPEEELVAFAPHLFRWFGPKAKFFLFGTVLGTVAVTDRRFLFLTGGQSWLAGQFKVLGQNLTGGARLADLDLNELANKDSIAIPLDLITTIEVKRRWDFASYLSVAGIDEDGEEVCVAFMPKLGLNADHLRAVAKAARAGAK